MWKKGNGHVCKCIEVISVGWLVITFYTFPGCDKFDISNNEWYPIELIAMIGHLLQSQYAKCVEYQK